MGIFQDFHEISIHFSKAIGTPIITPDGKKLGRLSDFFVEFEEVYPTVIAIQYKKSGQLFYIPWDKIKRFSFNKIILQDESFIGRSRTYPRVRNKRVINSLLAGQYENETIEYPPLGKVVLDRQIVDTNGKKVVRVNDIQFIKAGRLLKVTHAAIGFTSLVRRLGYEPLLDLILKVIKPNYKFQQSATLINWKFVHAIQDRTHYKNLKINLSSDDIRSLHPADLADILEDLDVRSRDMIFNELNPQLAAETLSEIEPDKQLSFINQENPKDIAKIIENMGTDEAADILNSLSDEKAHAVISNIKDQEDRKEIQELLQYKEDEAGGLMSTEVFTVSPNARKSVIMDMIQAEHKEIESIYDIYITDENDKLLGTCSLYKLLIQEEDIQIGEIMNYEDIKSLPPNVNWKEVAQHMSKYDLINVPIIDNNQELLGLISVDDVLPWLLKER